LRARGEKGKNCFNLRNEQKSARRKGDLLDFVNGTGEGVTEGENCRPWRCRTEREKSNHARKRKPPFVQNGIRFEIGQKKEMPLRKSAGLDSKKTKHFCKILPKRRDAATNG